MLQRGRASAASFRDRGARRPQRLMGFDDARQAKFQQGVRSTASPNAAHIDARREMQDAALGEGPRPALVPGRIDAYWPRTSRQASESRLSRGHDEPGSAQEN
jgi:hypothetical protein